MSKPDEEREFTVPSIHFAPESIVIAGHEFDLWTIGRDVHIRRSPAGSKTVTLTFFADEVTISDDNPDDDENGDFQDMRAQIALLDAGE